MIIFKNVSIKTILTILTILSTVPALAILFYTGVDRRQQIIDTATQQVSLRVKSMAEQQREIAQSTKQIMTILSQLPDVQQLNVENVQGILSRFIEQNSNYQNMVLIALDGKVIASAKGRAGIDLSDRKHFKDALLHNRFSVGEYIIPRIGSKEAAFPFAIPVRNDAGKPIAILATIIKLNNFSHYLDISEVPDGSFVAITDFMGIRLFYYPKNNDTNPLGEPIRRGNWEIARTSNGPKIFIKPGSDGKNRVFAFEPVSLPESDMPYLYVWSGIPEKLILAPANTVMMKSLLLLAVALFIALLVIHFIGKRAILTPLFNLVQLAGQLSKGNLAARCDSCVTVREFNELSEEFNLMAENLQNTNKKIAELSLIDGLTKVANRRGLDKKLEDEWRRALRAHQPISLLMIDIDYFKNFNDTYGHLSGDDCLRSLGVDLKRVSHRAADYPARYGGEEFVLILPETDYQGASAIAEIIHANVAERNIPHETSETAQYLTVSIGLVTLLNASSVKSPIELIKLADEQLYKAKREGRNRTSSIELT